MAWLAQTCRMEAAAVRHWARAALLAVHASACINGCATPGFYLPCHQVLLALLFANHTKRINPL